MGVLLLHSNMDRMKTLSLIESLSAKSRSSQLRQKICVIDTRLTAGRFFPSHKRLDSPPFYYLVHYFHRTHLFLTCPPTFYNPNRST